MQVTGVVGRAELISAIFFILSFTSNEKSKLKNGCKCRGTNFPPKVQQVMFKIVHYSAVKGHLWLVLSLFLSVVSLMSKEQGITVVAVCVAYDFLQKFQVKCCLLFYNINLCALSTNCIALSITVEPTASRD